MDKKAKNLEIIRTIIALAHDMGMEAIAEGIETRNQHEGLKKMGCNYGQGYLLSHPVDREKAESLLELLQVETKTSPAQVQPARFNYAD
jgi:EAL domain-containing protein (putative c-di-GMP-specific phosphodiesterase class I)